MIRWNIGELHTAVVRTAVLTAASILVTALIGGCALRVDEEHKAAEIEALQDASIGTLNNDLSVVYRNVTPDYVFTYAENQTEDYPTTQAAYRFAQLVNIRSKGKIQIRVYPNAQLGDETSTVEQLCMGGIDFVRASLSTLTEYSEESMVLMLPYLYRDSDHMWKVLDGSIGAQIRDSFQGSGFTGMSWFDAGVRNFYTRTAIHSIDEMKDLQIRVQPSEMMQDMIRELGGTPVPIAYENVYSALEQGNVDGAENNWSSYEAMQHYEVAPYFILDEHMRVPELQLISDVTLHQLSDKDQAMIRESAQDSAVYERYLWSQYEDEARRKVVYEGCRVISLEDEEKQRFRDAMAPLYEKYCGEYMDIVDQIEEVGE